jgi:hypothetical protein
MRAPGNFWLKARGCFHHLGIVPFIAPKKKIQESGKWKILELVMEVSSLGNHRTISMGAFSSTPCDWLPLGTPQIPQILWFKTWFVRPFLGAKLTWPDAPHPTRTCLAFSCSTLCEPSTGSWHHDAVQVEVTGRLGSTREAPDDLLNKIGKSCQEHTGIYGILCMNL